MVHCGLCRELFTLRGKDREKKIQLVIRKINIVFGKLRIRALQDTVRVYDMEPTICDLLCSRKNIEIALFFFVNTTRKERKMATHIVQSPKIVDLGYQKMLY